MVSPAVRTSPAAAPLNWRFVEMAGNKTQQDKRGGGEKRDRGKREENAFEYNLFHSLEASKGEKIPLGANHLHTTQDDETRLSMCNYCKKPP